MAEPEIRVSVTASTQAATAQLEDFGERTKRAMDSYNAAAARGKTVSDALGRSFDEAMTSGASFTEAMERATASVASYSSAATGAATATRSVTSTFYSAQGAAALLEGRVPIRAMERFLASSQAVSNVLVSGFGVIGVAAVADVLGHAAEKAYDLYEKFIDVDAAFKKLEDDAAQMRDKDLLNVKSIETANERLGQATENATKLREVAKGLSEDFSLGKAIAQLSTGDIASASFTFGMARSADELAKSSVKTTEQSIGLGLKQLEIQHEMNTLHIEAQHAYDGVLQGEAKINAELAKRLALNKENQQFERNREKALGNVAPQDAGAQQRALEDQIARGEAASQLAALQRKPDEGHKLAAQWGIDELRAKIRAVEEDTRNAEDEFNATVEQANRELNNGLEQQRKNAEAVARAYKETAQYAAQIAQEAMTEAEAKHSVAIAGINSKEGSGQLSKTGADQQKAAADAEMYREQLEALETELSKLTQGTEEYNRVLRQSDQLFAKSQASQLADTQKIAQDMSQPFINGMNTINNSWLQVQNKLIYGTRNVAQAFNNMGVSILESGAAWAERWLVQRLEMYVKDRIFHQVSQQQKVAADADAAAQSKAIGSAANVALAVSNSAVAVTGAAASQAPIPIVGPELAVAAMAAMQAATAPFITLAAFETGGIIPNTGVALVHQGEGVLPRNLTNLLTSVANNSSTQNSSTSIHSTANFNGITDRNFRDMVRRHSDAIAESVHSAIRSGKAKVA